MIFLKSLVKGHISRIERIDTIAAWTKPDYFDMLIYDIITVDDGIRPATAITNHDTIELEV